MVVKPIIDKYQILSKSEKKIADYFLENPNQAFGKSGEEISAITGTSPATLSRFVRKIGYKNLGDAKINLVKMLSTPQQTTIPEQMSLFVNEEDDFRKCGEKLLGQIQNVCASAQEVMDYQKLQLAVEKMKNARTIFLAGVGASNIVAQDLSIKLINIGCSVRYVLDPHVNMKSMLSAGQQDVLVAFSYSGTVELTWKTAELAARNGVFVISICGNKNSPLATYSNVLLQSPAMEQVVRLGAVSSHYSQQFVSDLLFLGLVTKTYAKAKETITEGKACMEEVRCWTS